MDVARRTPPPTGKLNCTLPGLTHHHHPDPRERDGLPVAPPPVCAAARPPVPRGRTARQALQPVVGHHRRHVLQQPDRDCLILVQVSRQSRPLPYIRARLWRSPARCSMRPRTAPTRSRRACLHQLVPEQGRGRALDRPHHRRERRLQTRRPCVQHAQVLSRVLVRFDHVPLRSAAPQPRLVAKRAAWASRTPTPLSMASVPSSHATS